MCTVESADHYSYRRDGVTGRHGVVVTLGASGHAVSDATRRRDVAARVAAVRARIDAAARAAGRDPDAVRLVAATKTQSVDAVRAVLAAGVADVGENRAQELVAKAPALADAGADVALHRPAPAQQDQPARAVGAVVAVGRPGRARRRARDPGRRAPGCSLEVNVAGEAQKGGCTAADDARRSSTGPGPAGSMPVGLMTVAPAAGDPRPVFAALRELAERLGLAELSMGMSGDFEAAIAEGATIVRVGTALFGPRPPRRSA